MTSRARSGARNNTTISILTPSSISDLIGIPDIVAPASLGCTGTTLQPL